MRKNYVLDTSVLMNDHESIYSFKGNNVIVTSTVIEELNEHKDGKDSRKAYLARKALNEIMDLLKNNKEKITREEKVSIIPLDNGIELRLEMNHVSFENIKEHFDKDIPDNRILAVTSNYDNGVLVTDDKGLFVKAFYAGVNVEEYYNGLEKKPLKLYKGYTDVEVNMDVRKEFNKNKKIELDKVFNKEEQEKVYINEYIRMKVYETGENLIGRVVERKGVRVIQRLIVDYSSSFSGIRAKSDDQLMVLDALEDDNIPLVNIVGPAGTGKTLLAIAYALSSRDLNKYKKVLAFKSLSAVGNQFPGFLPGDLVQKISPYMGSYHDNLEFIFNHDKKDVSEHKSLEEILSDVEGYISLESTGLTRGRTWPEILIIIDEAQNLTKGEIITLLSRVGHKAKIILTGDPTQIDSSYLTSTNNGYVYEIEKMKVSEASATISMFTEGKRSFLANEVVRLM